ncbi:hypothetical protein DFR67_103161 [Williamsia limnetica]|uniref:Uncharacterized protein n=1 Tax=Williamsia limnetica TaxID=882452 RepID=A0A318RRD4_WILLI|nr:hypothetical protein [Williamsia limnetica]PYE19250.1 hypothetical protein DFR67_103161 [Williamsia limnetica]
MARVRQRQPTPVEVDVGSRLPEPLCHGPNVAVFAPDDYAAHRGHEPTDPAEAFDIMLRARRAWWAYAKMYADDHGLDHDELRHRIGRANRRPFWP